jgi:hypothetical protein
VRASQKKGKGMVSRRISLFPRLEAMSIASTFIARLSDGLILAGSMLDEDCLHPFPVLVPCRFTDILCFVSLSIRIGTLETEGKANNQEAHDIFSEAISRY